MADCSAKLDRDALKRRLQAELETAVEAVADSIAGAHSSLLDYIEAFYIRIRHHSALGRRNSSP